MLSREEILALQTILDDAISKSVAEDDGDPIYHEVEVTGVNPFTDKHQQSDVYNNLSNKGLILCSGYEDVGGFELEFVCITPSGLAEIKRETGVH